MCQNPKRFCYDERRHARYPFTAKLIFAILKKSEGIDDMLPDGTGIRDNVLEQICELARKYDLHKVMLFGSRARGDFKERSDIDLAVSGGNIFAFSAAVDEETETLLQYDVVNLDSRVDKELLDNIRKDGIMLYEKI